MKNFRIAFISLVFLVGSLVNISVIAAPLKIATLAPEGSEWMKEHRAAADLIAKRTDGRVVLKFYGGGVMGNDKKVLRKIRIGQLQGAAFTTSGLAERYPDIVLYGMPFMFRSQEEVDFVRKELDPILLKGLEDAGFVSFGFAGGGFANFMSSSPISSHANLKNKKIWVPDGDIISFTALQSMDLSPVVLPLSDVMTGLQTGLLDVIVTPPMGALLLQWYTKVNYINPMPVAYTMGMLAIDSRAFDRLSAEDQNVLRDVLANTYLRLDVINRTDNIEAQDALLANGLKLVDSNPADVPFWQSVADKTNAEFWAKSSQNQDLLGDMLQLLKKYRESSKPAAAASGN